MNNDPALGARAIALCRKAVRNSDEFSFGSDLMSIIAEIELVREARAIVALLPPEVTIALLEARKLFADHWSGDREAVLAGNYDGHFKMKELERAIAHGMALAAQRETNK